VAYETTFGGESLSARRNSVEMFKTTVMAVHGTIRLIGSSCLVSVGMGTLKNEV
jgi:hypothetical protein